MFAYLLIHILQPCRLSYWAYWEERKSTSQYIALAWRYVCITTSYLYYLSDFECSFYFMVAHFVLVVITMSTYFILFFGRLTGSIVFKFDLITIGILSDAKTCIIFIRTNKHIKKKHWMLFFVKIKIDCSVLFSFNLLFFFLLLSTGL